MGEEYLSIFQVNKIQFSIITTDNKEKRKKIHPIYKLNYIGPT